MRSYLEAVSDPGLQQQIYDAESTYRPQYDALNLQQIQRMLSGYDGNPGLLEQYDLATQKSAETLAAAQTTQREADIADVENLGARATKAFQDANPDMFAAIKTAQGLQDSGGTNPYKAFSDAVTAGQPNFGTIYPPTGKAATLGSAPTASSQGYNGLIAGYGPQVQGATYNGLISGYGPQVKGQGYAGLIAGYGPQVQGQGYNAALQGGVANINAGSVGEGMLGQSLYNRAMGPEMGATGQALQARATQLAGSTGQLTPDEIRNLQQATRQAYAARGTELSSASVSAEALSRLTNERQRMVEDLGMASALNQAGLSEIGQNRAFAQSVQGADIARQQQNVGFNMGAQAQNQQAQLSQLAANQAAQNQAGMFGAQAANQAALANQAAIQGYDFANQQSYNQAAQFGAQAANQAALANQAAIQGYDLANQQSYNQAGQFNAQSQNQARLANQAAIQAYDFANQQSYNQAGMFAAQAANQAALANQAMQGQYGLANQAVQQQMELTNMNNWMNAQLQNRDFAANRYDQQLQNLGVLGQFGQSQLGYDRNYALQLAGLQGNVASDPFQAILGRPSQAGQYGMANQQGAIGMLGAQGPQLFDPNAGVNLALQNNANLGNYQAATYGAQAAAQGAMGGGLFGALGSIGGGFLGNVGLFG